ncbi:MAG: hypothetical protein HYW48_09655 [Deltaproteobacteria bacterium]|nr:hypothetical protein [Deltaproteobacteria bacterium]
MKLVNTIILIVMFGFHAQCTHAQKQQQLTMKIVDKTGGPNVSKEWQSVFLSKWEGSDVKEGWGLFTCCGGWAPDDGQYMVIAGDKEAQFIYVKPFSKKVDEEKALPEKMRQGFLADMRAFDTLGNKFEVAFDQINLEYVHARREGDRIIILQRVHMNLIDKKDAEHWHLIQTFKNLVGN